MATQRSGLLYKVQLLIRFCDDNNRSKAVTKNILLDILVLRSCLFLFVPPIFLFKVLKVGSYGFHFDDAGIVRSSKQGELIVP